MAKREIKKSDIDYRKWLLIYKGKDLDKITLNEHTKYSKLFSAWRTGNIERL